MKNVSSAFREQLNNDNRDYIKSADVTLKDGTVLHVDNSDMWNNGLTIEDATSNTNSFDIGAVIIGSATLVLNNIYDEYTEYDFTDCVMSNVKVGLELPDETIESLQYGKYYLDEAKYNGSIITLNFFDGISKFDKDYSKSNLIYPATLLQIVQDACTVCGIALGTPSFDNDDYVVETRPVSDSLTFRQVLAWVAQISCNYCKCDEQGRLCLEWYDIETLENMALYTEETPLGDLSGSDILDHESQQIITIIEQESANSNTLTSGIGQYQTLNSNVSLSTGLDDVVITGIKVVQEIEGDEGTETVVYQSGTDGYVLSIEGNKLIQGDNGDLVSNMIAIKTVGIRFRTFEASTFSDPTIEAGDVALLIDRKGKRYKSLITNNRFTPGNFQMILCGAESPARKSASRYSQITQVYVDYRKELEKERTDREEALDELSERMDNSSGLFTTEEIQPDGSTIFYMHDKPLLSESQIIWRMTAEAWGVSTDGGQSYNAGMTVDGDTIVRILTATGINANWINSGAISIEDQDGNETFYADTATGQVRISANSFSLQGQSITEIAGEEIDDFVDSVYTPQINNLQAQIDGQIETWFYDYVPTTSNYPASEWTTDTEKDKHLGDLFYVVDNEEYGGQAYRWAKINNAYTWDYVEDTAVTKALADAAAAKDTADQKRRVFVAQPTPPYDVGDLWVGNSASDLMRCQTARQSGSYNAADWIKGVKYTDDSELNTFINNTYNVTIQELENSLDQKSEVWYQATDPALEWTNNENSPLMDVYGNNILDTTGDTITTIWEKEKYVHDGDLWKNSNTNVEYYYQDGNWVEMPIPDAIFDTIDGKAQIFVTQPIPPYNVGDLWFNSATSDIMTCITARSSGSYAASDWQKRNKYTDDSYAEQVAENLSIFSSTVTGDLENLQTEIDGKIETYYYDYQPTLTNVPASQWTTAQERAKHVGDLFYWQSKGFTYRFTPSGSSYVWQPIQDSDITEALNQAAAAQDTADGKRRVFITTPVPPYDVGDLWAQGDVGDIMRCIVARSSGSYVSTDWDKASKYTDDTAVDDLDNALDQEGVFNRLTNNGTLQGIYMQNGRLYINATYIVTGKITSKNGLVFFDLDNNEIHCDKLVSTQPYSLVANTVVDITRRNIGGSNYVYGVQVYNENYETKRVTISPGNNDDHPVISTGTTADPTGISIRSRVSNGNYTGNAYLEFLDNGWVELSAPTGGSVDPLIRLFPGRYTDSDGTTSDLAGSVTISGTTIDLYATDVNVSNRLNVRGSKSRLVKTKDYGERVFYCYETSSPMFGDIGEATIDENGECVITIDDIFAETVASHIEYHVFLQKEGAGDLWVEEKNERYFIVKGTKNLKFSWEIKAKQRDYEYERLDEYGVIYPIDEATPELFYESEIENIIAEQEAVLYEAAE